MIIDLENYPILELLIQSQLDTLLYTTSIFFEYIIQQRDGYITINGENIKNNIIKFPRVNSIMINYVANNILNINYNQTMNYEILNVVQLIKKYLKTKTEELKRITDITGDYYNSCVNINLSSELRIKLSGLKKEETQISDKVIENDVETSINYFMNVILNTILNKCEDITNLDEIQDIIGMYITQEGTNAFNQPKDYGFLSDEENIIVQSFIWVLCGLNDWLEKEIITNYDIETALKIIVPKQLRLITGSFFDKNIVKTVLQNDAEQLKRIKDNLNVACFMNNFYISTISQNSLNKGEIELPNDAITKFALCFMNINKVYSDFNSGNIEDKYKALINKIKYFSIII